MAMIKQVVISKRGGPDVLKVENVPQPEPGPGQVRIRVLTAGVAFADIMMREGIYPGTPPIPFVPGYDIVGRVDSIGKGVDDLKVGQRVAVLCQFGGYTESLVIDSWLAVPVPDGVADDDAVSLVLNYMTAYQMLRRIARLEAGERILIHGAGGGAGTALLQLGAWMKLKMWGTASKSKRPVIESYNAVHIDYKSQDFVEAVLKDTGDGVDAVFDPIGGKNWKASLKALRPGGRLVGYGFSSALEGGRRKLVKAAIALLQTPRWSILNLVPKNLGAFGFSVQNLRMDRRDWYREDMKKVMELCAAGIVKPVIGKRLPLTEAAEAHRILGDSRITGKIVLYTEGKSVKRGVKGKSSLTKIMRRATGRRKGLRWNIKTATLLS